jgi:hypothetical protein
MFNKYKTKKNPFSLQKITSDFKNIQFFSVSQFLVSYTFLETSPSTNDCISQEYLLDYKTGI